MSRFFKAYLSFLHSCLHRSFHSSEAVTRLRLASAAEVVARCAFSGFETVFAAGGLFSATSGSFFTVCDFEFLSLKQNPLVITNNNGGAHGTSVMTGGSACYMIILYSPLVHVVRAQLDILNRCS